MLTLLGIAVAALPLVLIVALLGLSGWLQRRRLAEIARQIRLTNAIHARLGAAAAPVVRKPLARPWQVHVAAPLERPEVVDPLLAIIREEFAEGEGWWAAPFQIVLSQQEKPVARSSRPATAAARPKESMSWT